MSKYYQTPTSIDNGTKRYTMMNERLTLNAVPNSKEREHLPHDRVIILFPHIQSANDKQQIVNNVSGYKDKKGISPEILIISINIKNETRTPQYLMKEAYPKLKVKTKVITIGIKGAKPQHI